MSGHWTGDWDDQDDDDFPAGADPSLVSAEADGRLAAVSAWLAAAPAAAVPDGVADRVSAAIAAESASRTADQTAAGPASGPASATPEAGTAAGPAGTPGPPSRVLFPDPRPARVRRLRRLPTRYLKLSSSVAAVCLVLAGFGYLFSLSSSSDSSSGVAGSAAGPATHSNSGSGSTAAGSSASAAAPSAVPGAGRTASGASSAASASSAATFTLRQSGTRYRESALAQQVKHQLAAASPGAPGRAAPSATLRGCVLQVTGGAAPSLVDRATYQGKAAYVIATRERAWVVGPGCTAKNTELVASVPLAG